MTWQPVDRHHRPADASLARPEPANLADVLERVLDKGIVIAGDIRVDLVDIELLTIRIRLLVASVDRAREMGIDWWRHDPMLSSRAARDGHRRVAATAEREGPASAAREGPASAARERSATGHGDG
jgi:hypothetical protein